MLRGRVVVDFFFFRRKLSPCPQQKRKLAIQRFLRKRQNFLLRGLLKNIQSSHEIWNLVKANHLLSVHWVLRTTSTVSRSDFFANQFMSLTSMPGSRGCQNEMVFSQLCVWHGEFPEIIDVQSSKGVSDVHWTLKIARFGITKFDYAHILAPRVTNSAVLDSPSETVPNARQVGLRQRNCKSIKIATAGRDWHFKVNL